MFIFSLYFVNVLDWTFFLSQASNVIGITIALRCQILQFQLFIYTSFIIFFNIYIYRSLNVMQNKSVYSTSIKSMYLNNKNNKMLETGLYQFYTFLYFRWRQEVMANALFILSLIAGNLISTIFITFSLTILYYFDF